MAKFNKDTFLNEITSKVQSAIDKGLITSEDIAHKDLDRLHGFIQYELLEYIEDRKFAIDVLKDFNYDEKMPWDKLQADFGEFKSLMDIALVNLWKFLDAEGSTKYEFYNHNAYEKDAPFLDTVHNIQKDDVPPYEEPRNMQGSNMRREESRPQRKISVRPEPTDEGYDMY